MACFCGGFFTNSKQNVKMWPICKGQLIISPLTTNALSIICTAAFVNRLSYLLYCNRGGTLRPDGLIGWQIEAVNVFMGTNGPWSWRPMRTLIPTQHTEAGRQREGGRDEPPGLFYTTFLHPKIKINTGRKLVFSCANAPEAISHLHQRCLIC